MGMTFAPFGMFAGFASVTYPSMLAAQGLSGDKIAGIISIILIPGFVTFLLAPMMDLWLKRRTYAVIFTLISAVAIGYTTAFRTDVHLTVTVMLICSVANMLSQGAIGGWTGSLIRKEDDSKLAAWMGVANLGAGGVMPIVAGYVLSRLHPAAAGYVLAALVVLPLVIYPLVPAPEPDVKLASEKYAQFFRDLFALVKQRRVQSALVLFTLPASTFALSNVLSGLGPDYHTSERLQGLLSGVGVVVAGCLGNLLFPVLAKRFPLRPLYLGLGVVGAVFTLSLLLLPHTPWAFALGFTGETFFQAMGLTAVMAIAFETMGPENPFAATLFSLLMAAALFSLFYMGLVDGHAYSWRGVAGSFVVDAAVSSVVALGLGAIFFWGRSKRSSPPENISYAAPAAEIGD